MICFIVCLAELLTFSSNFTHSELQSLCLIALIALFLMRAPLVGLPSQIIKIFINVKSTDSFNPFLYLQYTENILTQFD